MATSEADPSPADAFGRVSRSLGVAFRYPLLAAPLVGVVSLGILLVFVTNDAIQPLSASPGWLAVALVTLLAVPGSLAVGLRAR